MKTSLLKLATLIVLPAALLTFTSCSSTGGKETAEVLDTKDGVTIVDTTTTSATVTGIDPATRTVTLRLAGGKTSTVKCGPQVTNFDQIKRDDRVNVTMTDRLAVFLGQGRPPGVAGAAAVALAPVGSKPGVMMADTIELTVKITALDPVDRVVTVESVDGSSNTFRVGRQINLAALKVGDNVTMQHTEALVVTLEKQ